MVTICSLLTATIQSPLENLNLNPSSKINTQSSRDLSVRQNCNMVPELTHMSKANGLRAQTRPKLGQQLVNKALMQQVTMQLLIPTQQT